MLSILSNLILELIGVMIAFMVLAILYEGLKAFRETVKIKELAERRKKSMNNGMLKMYSETRPLVDRVEFVYVIFFSYFYTLSHCLAMLGLPPQLLHQLPMLLLSIFPIYCGSSFVAG